MARWAYRNRRPTRLGRTINRAWSWVASMGLFPARWPGETPWGTLTLEVAGRRSGCPRSTVVTWVGQEGQRYLVSMLGEGADWVKNVRAAGGQAVLRHRRRRWVRLDEVPVEKRAPILKAYLQKTAISTRRHLGLDPKAPLDEFERIAPDHPVFRIVEPPA